MCDDSVVWAGSGREDFWYEQLRRSFAWEHLYSQSHILDLIIW